MPPRPPVHQAASRRKRSKGDLTSQAILDTAERLLESRSLDEIAVDELTSGAGVSRSTFYFHFESREAVLRALSEQVAVELHECAALWLRRGGEPPEDAIRRALTATVALWRHHGPVLRAAMRARDVSPQMQEFWSGVARRFIDAAAEQIERERTAGVALAGPPDARLLATVLENMNEQACFTQSLSRRSPVRDRKLVDALTTIWLRSVYGVTSANGQ